MIKSNKKTAAYIKESGYKILTKTKNTRTSKTARSPKRSQEPEDKISNGHKYKKTFSKTVDYKKI